MPITLKTARMRYKNPTTGQYVGVNSVGDADLAEQIQAVEDSIAPDYADLVFPVAAGQKCYHENVLYEANQAIPTSEAWTAAHWSELTIAQDISAIKNALNQKQEKPESTGQAGQVLGLALVDGQLVPVWITPASGGGDVTDVQIDGTSILDAQGVANVPLATMPNDNQAHIGLVKLKYANGLAINQNGILTVNFATAGQVREGTSSTAFCAASTAKNVAFNGLANAAGDTTQKTVSGVGNYTENAKSAISNMLNAPETISGTTPVITAKPGIRYICGECATLDITAPASGIVDIVFESGSTPTVLTVTPPTGITAVKWANGFGPSSLEANTKYEISIMDGELGAALSWT